MLRVCSDGDIIVLGLFALLCGLDGVRLSFVRVGSFFSRAAGQRRQIEYGALDDTG